MSYVVTQWVNTRWVEIGGGSADECLALITQCITERKPCKLKCEAKELLIWDVVSRETNVKLTIRKSARKILILARVGTGAILVLP